MKNIYLIGMMGSGKTATGFALSRILKIPFVDVDEMIVKRAGKTINNIFADHDEVFFRGVEREVLASVAARTDQVISTGGGIVLDPANQAVMKTTGTVIYLNTGLETLWKRVRARSDRPLLLTDDPKKTLETIFLVRKTLYEQTADFVFLTDDNTPHGLAEEIVRTCFPPETHETNQS